MMNMQSIWNPDEYHRRKAEVLISLGAIVEKGEPLLAAIKEHHPKLVRQLLSRGASISGSSWKTSPLRMLFSSIREDPEDINEKAGALVNAGADVDEIEEGTSILCGEIFKAHCCYWNPDDGHDNELWMKNIECLLRQGVDVDQVDKNGDTPLIHAFRVADKAHRTMLLGALLYAQAKVNISNSRGQTALMSWHLNCTDIEKLVTYGADVDAVDVGGQSALHVAIRNNNRAMAEELLEPGIDTSLRDRWGHTAHHYSKLMDEEVELPSLQGFARSRNRK